MEVLGGVRMELEDAALPLLAGTSPTVAMNARRLKSPAHTRHLAQRSFSLWSPTLLSPHPTLAPPNPCPTLAPPNPQPAPPNPLPQPTPTLTPPRPCPA